MLLASPISGLCFTRAASALAAASPDRRQCPPPPRTCGRCHTPHCPSYHSRISVYDCLQPDGPGFLLKFGGVFLVLKVNFRSFPVSEVNDQIIDFSEIFHALLLLWPVLSPGFADRLQIPVQPIPSLKHKRRSSFYSPNHLRTAHHSGAEELT